MNVVDVTIPVVIVTAAVAITLIVDLACSILDRVADHLLDRRLRKHDEVVLRWSRRDSGD